MSANELQLKKCSFEVLSIKLLNLRNLTRHCMCNLEEDSFLSD